MCVGGEEDVFLVTLQEQSTAKHHSMDFKSVLYARMVQRLVPGSFKDISDTGSVCIQTELSLMDHFCIKLVHCVNMYTYIYIMNVPCYCIPFMTGASKMTHLGGDGGGVLWAQICSWMGCLVLSRNPRPQSLTGCAGS